MSDGSLHAAARVPALAKEIGFWHDVLDLALSGRLPVQFDQRTEDFFKGAKLALGMAAGCMDCRDTLLPELNNIKDCCESIGGELRRIDEVN